VLNRPTPRSLSGPAWAGLHWAVAAAEVQIAWVAEPVGPTHDVVICGDSCRGARTAGEEQAARALARHAGVELLGVRFCASGACAASTIPPLNTGDVRAAVLGHLDRRGAA
jgi:hypothetical protein